MTAACAPASVGTSTMITLSDRPLRDAIYALDCLQRSVLVEIRDAGAAFRPSLYPTPRIQLVVFE